MLQNIAALTLSWLKSFKPEVSIDKVITTDGQEFDMPSDFKATVEGNLTYTHRAEDVFNLFDDGKFNIIRGVKLWKDMTGQTLKESKRVMAIAEIAYLIGIEEEKARTERDEGSDIADRLAEIDDSTMIENYLLSSDEDHPHLAEDTLTMSKLG